VTGRIRILAPLRGRDFRLLWCGLVVSLTGDGIFMVAVAWQAYTLRNSPLALAGVGMAAALSQLTLALLGGAVSDRLPRRTVLVLSDAVRGAALALLAVASWAGHLLLWHLWAAAAVVGAGAAFASPAFDAIVPELVPPAQLQHANGLDQVLRPITLRLLGPAAGGVLVATVGAPGAFLLDALSFAVSAWCLRGIDLLPSGPSAVPGDAARDGASLWTDLRRGVAYVRHHVWLWGTLIAATLSYLLFLGPTEVLLPYLLRNRLHAGAGSLGLVLAAGGVGALGGAVVIGQRDRLRRPVTLMYACWSGATLLVAGYGLTQRRWALVVTALAFNALEAAGAVIWSTLKQRLVPGDLLGRVSGIDWFVSTSLTPLSFALTPLVAQALGLSTTFLVAGGAGAATMLAFLFLPGMRLHDRAATSDVGAAPEPEPERAAPGPAGNRCRVASPPGRPARRMGAHRRRADALHPHESPR
jgi:MFS family permease